MRLVILLLALSALSACGLKGDLYLPAPKPKPAPAAQPAPAASSDQAQAPAGDRNEDDEPAGAPASPVRQ